MWLRMRRRIRHSSSKVASPATEQQGKDEAIALRRKLNKPSMPQGTKIINGKNSFVVAKWAILRLLGAIYFFAFLGAYLQNKGLFGEHGLQPASRYMSHLKQHAATPWQGFLMNPTLFWWFKLDDSSMDAIAFIGLALSGLVIVGLNSWLIMFLLWILDFSLVTIAGGTSFYSYGWESQLLETGFLAIFLCDLPNLAYSKELGWRFNATWKDHGKFGNTSKVVIIWLFRWLSFRISIGAGLIKIRGSSCWTDKTCLWYHFETQPLPSPLSFIFHFLPKQVLSYAVDLDLLVQLYTSWFVLVPGSIPGVQKISSILKSILRLGGFIQIAFMFNILLSGNFAFLNHLTIIPSLACLDDNCWPRVIEVLASKNALPCQAEEKDEKFYLPPRSIVDLGLVLLIGWLSLPVVTNLLQLNGSSQVMNASFNSFRLVNTYGAFGSVGQARYEPIIAVSINGSDWTELDFPCKPGKVDRRPCFCAPYHYRLDWNIWFIGFPPHSSYLQQRERWLYKLLEKILGDDDLNQAWLSLLDKESVLFLKERHRTGKRPKFTKVDMYQYQMVAPLWKIVWNIIKKEHVTWWRRDYKESLIPVVEFDSERSRLSYALH